MKQGIWENGHKIIWVNNKQFDDVTSGTIDYRELFKKKQNQTEHYES